ncbi:hypothetical protein [Acidithiobacillus marinus]|nr:hypothetical protein [Acidithiobacillus marinus]
MNIPDQLMLGGAAIALVSVIMAVLVVLIGNHDLKKKQHDHHTTHKG